MYSWIKQHGPTLAMVATVGVSVWLSASGLKTDMSLQQGAVANLQESVGQQLTSQSVLLDEKLKPLHENIKETNREIEILKSDVEGMSIASTQGAEAAARRLSGKITALQQTMFDIKTNQESLADTMETLQTDVGGIRIRLSSRLDTLFSVLADSLGAPVSGEKNGSFWRSLSPFH